MAAVAVLRWEAALRDGGRPDARGSIALAVSSLSSFLSNAGRLPLTKLVVSTLPTFAMCTYHLPKIVFKKIDKYRKHLFVA